MKIACWLKPYSSVEAKLTFASSMCVWVMDNYLYNGDWCSFTSSDIFNSFHVS